MSNFIPTKYRLQSLATSKQFEDTGWLLDAPNEKQTALIRTVYDKRQIEVGSISEGIYRFADWLPIHRTLEGSSSPITYKSVGLAKELGLKELYITFSGYWPEKNCLMKSCSFKETEAYSVCGRLSKDEKKVLVVASAGNTARAFANVCSENNIPLLLCVPEDNLSSLWFNKPIQDCVQLVVVEKGCDYFDAINLSNLICTLPEFFAEGGAKNVARRDGMGTTTLSAITTIGKIPEIYFQAIGSGTGAIAAWEANKRILSDGRYGEGMMKLLLSQNEPFIPIYNAWKNRSRSLMDLDDDLARDQIQIINAKVLSNRNPPYSIVGGLYDAMTEAGGDIITVNNEAGEEAAKIFEMTEGIDIHPASAIAVASLKKAIKDKEVNTSSCILLNITGGGEKLFAKEYSLNYLKPSIVVNKTTLEESKVELNAHIKEELLKLFNFNK